MCDKGQYFLAHFRFLTKSRFPIFKLNICEDYIDQKIWVASLTRKRDLKSFIFSSKRLLEELVLKSLRASPLIKPFLTLGAWQEEKCVLERLSWFEMRFNVKEVVFVGSFAFEYCCVYSRASLYLTERRFSRKLCIKRSILRRCLHLK